MAAGFDACGTADWGSRCAVGIGGTVGDGFMAGTEGAGRLTSGVGFLALGVDFGVTGTSGGVFAFRGGSMLGVDAIGRADTTELAASGLAGPSFDGNADFDGDVTTV